jgi:hypothetical protein
MDESIDIDELQEIYQGMDTKGKKKMATAATQLLKIQKSFDHRSVLYAKDSKTQCVKEGSSVMCNVMSSK